jgi:hypothetical protein
MYRLNAAGALWQDDDPNRISLKMLKLVIGNKNYSSWSMRPWLALRANGIPFEEVFIPLYTDEKADKDRILSFQRCGKSADAGRWRHHGVGFACHHRISAENSAHAAVAEDRAACAMRGRFRRRCIRASWRCATNAA